MPRQNSNRLTHASINIHLRQHAGTQPRFDVIQIDPHLKRMTVLIGKTKPCHIARAQLDDIGQRYHKLGIGLFETRFIVIPFHPVVHQLAVPVD